MAEMTTVDHAHLTVFDQLVLLFQPLSLRLALGVDLPGEFLDFGCLRIDTNKQPDVKIDRE